MLVTYIRCNGESVNVFMATFYVILAEIVNFALFFRRFNVIFHSFLDKTLGNISKYDTHHVFNNLNKSI